MSIADAKAVRKLQRQRLAACVGLAGMLLINVIFFVEHTGTRAGTSYRWVSDATAAELTFAPSKGFLNATHLRPGRGGPSARHRWRQVEPPPLSIWKLWQWLALAFDTGPDPKKIAQNAVVSEAP
jgi:hypothetical protein